ncbi:MAG: phosphate ABC transporter permease subunit PstC [Acidimicrobiales bacterium]|nr:phosphate ABC transporter permease subunit PstC [Acidimicrobiales bacterium]
MRPRRPVRAYSVLCWTAVGLFAAVLAAVAVTIGAESARAWAHAGLGFLWSGTWNPARDHYGGGLLVVGTVVTTGCAMLLAVPIGLGIAVYLAELSPRWLSAPVSAAIDLLAAVPSIVVGLWALLVVSPFFARDVEPTLARTPGLRSVFAGPAYGPGILLAAVVLTIMVLPTVVALSRNALQAVSGAEREAARALGATPWQVVRTAVLPAARPGIAGAVTLAVGRALGESIAVAMVIGNRPGLPRSLLQPGATLGSAIVNQFGEASPGLGESSVVALAAVLLALTVAVNAAGIGLLGRGGPPGRPAPGPPRRLAESPGAVGPAGAGPTGLVLLADPIDAATRSLPRRRWASRVMYNLCAACVIAGAAPLVALLYYTIARGHGALSLGFLTQAPRPAGIPGGGIATAISGSAKIVGLGLVMAVPVGLLSALFLYDRRGKAAGTIRFGADVLTGVPSIVLGIFAYGVLVRPFHHSSTVAAGFALAVLMVPIMIGGNEEALRAVPEDLFEAGLALGARRARVAGRIVVREALARLVTANLLAASRGVGETAPLLFTVAAPSAALTLLIFDRGPQAFASAQQTAWACALVLLAAVLALGATARAVAWRLTRHQR